MLRFPLKVRRFCGIRGEPNAYLITDATERSINICCDANPLRREIAKLWSPEEAEAIAKTIARMLTDHAETEAAIDELVRQNAAGKRKL